MSRCHLGLWNRFNIQMMFGLEIPSESKDEPLRNIRVLSQGTPPPCTRLLHIASPNSFNGCRKQNISLCPASKIIKGGTNPHPVILHTHLLHFPHLPLPSPPDLHALQKKSSFRKFVLKTNHQILLSWEIYPICSSSLQAAGRAEQHKVLLHVRAERHHPLSREPRNDRSLDLN